MYALRSRAVAAHLHIGFFSPRKVFEIHALTITDRQTNMTNRQTDRQDKYSNPPAHELNCLYGVTCVASCFVLCLCIMPIPKLNHLARLKSIPVTRSSVLESNGTGDY